MSRQLFVRNSLAHNASVSGGSMQIEEIERVIYLFSFGKIRAGVTNQGANATVWPSLHLDEIAKVEVNHRDPSFL
jgi:hypothetical protein